MDKNISTALNNWYKALGVIYKPYKALQGSQKLISKNDLQNNMPTTYSKWIEIRLPSRKLHQSNYLD